MSEWKMPAAMRKRVEEQIKNMSVEEAEKFRTQRDELERTLTPKVPEPKDVAEAGREQKMIKSGPEAAEAEVLRFRRLPRPLPVAEPEPLVRGHEEIVLNPGAPKDIANEFVKRECSFAGICSSVLEQAVLALEWEVLGCRRCGGSGREAVRVS